MVCLYCGGATKITNSRQQKKLNRKWRRRQCLTCSQVFTTIESFSENSSILVNKGTIEPILTPFSRDNLFISVYRSCEHRPSALFDASMITDTITSHLLPKVEQSCVPIALIQQVAYKTLKRFDSVAATYYKAYYWGSNK